MFTEPEANNCFSIIFRAEQRGLLNNGLKHKNKMEIVRLDTPMQPIICRDRFVLSLQVERW